MVLNRISKHIRRYSADGIDVQVLPWDIDSVVSVNASYACPVDLGAGEGLTLELMAAMLDKGTKSRSKAVLADRLERIGASISFSANGDRLDVGARCLARDLATVLELIREQVAEPAFDERELSLVKGRTRAHLSRRQSDPAYMSRNRLSRHLYGADHPSHELPVEELARKIEELQTGDLDGLHARPAMFDGLRTAIVGDVDALSPAEAATTLSVRPNGEGREFGKGTISFRPAASPGLHHIQIEDRPNLDVLMAHPVDVSTTSSTYLPLWVGVFVLGGNFSSRLMSEIRDEKGLTYGIRSYLSGMDASRSGAWVTSVTLSADKLDEGIDATRIVLDRFAQNGVSDLELEERKQTMIGSYEVDLSTTSGVASRMLLHMNRGWDPDRIDTHPEIIAAIHTDEVNRVVGGMLDPEALTVVTAGSKA